MIMNKHNTFPSSSTTHTNIEDAELGSESLQSFLQDAWRVMHILILKLIFTDNK